MGADPLNLLAIAGMAIVTLLGTGLIFKLFGWTDLTGKITALTIGTIVCISASIAGDISQDLKTGFIIGATPRKQQISELLGAVVFTECAEHDAETELRGGVVRGAG